MVAALLAGNYSHSYNVLTREGNAVSFLRGVLAQQKKLQEELQKRAEDARKNLEKQQGSGGAQTPAPAPAPAPAAAPKK